MRGYGRTEGKHVDSARAPTRKGAEKAQPVSLTPEQAVRLKAQPDTPQGRRDALLLCLLLDHGLRVGEVAGLAVSDFDLAAGELRFYTRLRCLPTTQPIPGGAYRHSIISLTIRSEGARFSGTHWPHIVGTLASGY